MVAHLRLSYSRHHRVDADLPLFRMQRDLHMNSKNNAYSIVNLVFFITYTIFQAPATILIRSIGPRRFLAAIVLLWGATMIVSGQNIWRLPFFFVVALTDRLKRDLASCPTGKSWLGSA